MKNECISFPPVVDSNSRIIILGTMPGKISLETGEYYANPNNNFWFFISKITSENDLSNYSKKIEALLKNGIAIWDVLKYCERKTSLDIDIKNEYPNNFESFFLNYLKIKNVFFNGTTAYILYKKHIGFGINRIYSRLPSSSNTPGRYVKNIAEKLKEWEKLQECDK